MPTYEYQCDSCRRVFEIRQRISEPPLATCEACGGPVRRLLSAAPFILKGEGWYVTDYPSESRKKAVESEKSAEKSAAPASTSSEASGASEKSSTPAAGATAATPSPSASSPAASSAD
jgi:putative FmdB family regulatory protein